MALVNNPVLGVNVRKNTNMKSTAYGKYYPEVDAQPTLNIRGFAKHMIDHGSKYSRGDIENILSMVTECLPELVAQGISVELGDLGIFRPTIETEKPFLNILEMEGANPNDYVKAVHIRFIPNQTKLGNLCGPAFKDHCTLELRNVVETEKIMEGNKVVKTLQHLTPVATAVYEAKHPEPEP